MMDGRVKTLNPKIHGGILAVRSNPKHMEDMKKNGIKPIDLVVCNLYPFEATIAKPNVTEAEAIENIDIGGPAWFGLRQRISTMWWSSRIRIAMPVS